MQKNVISVRHLLFGEKLADYAVGDIVTCLLKNRSSLTVGKEYKIEGISNEYEGGEFRLEIRNDYGYVYSYHYSRFMPKSIKREIKINEILK